jgi:hypothetical protein
MSRACAASMKSTAARGASPRASTRGRRQGASATAKLLPNGTAKRITSRRAAAPPTNMAVPGAEAWPMSRSPSAAIQASSASSWPADIAAARRISLLRNVRTRSRWCSSSQRVSR